MSTEELSERWLTPNGRVLAREVAFRLVTGTPFDDIEIGRHEGRIDLRGFSLPGPDRVGQQTVGSKTVIQLDGLIELRDLTWRGLDLSHSRLTSLRMFGVTIVDCVFDNASCDDWRLWDTKVSRSRFVRASLKGALIGSFYSGKGNRWEDVTFERSDLRGCVLLGSQFIGCEFLNVKFGGSGFTRCHLERVTFAGKLRNMLFDMRHIPSKPEPDPGPIQGANFVNATFDNVEFQGAKFVDTVFADDSDLVIVGNYPPVARWQLQILESHESSYAKRVGGLIRRSLSSQTSDDWSEVFNRRDRVDWGGEELADLAESTLLQAIEETETAGVRDQNLTVTTRASLPLLVEDSPAPKRWWARSPKALP